ncbi:acyl-CoA dehydrogenase family protein [Massilia sp. METH4]|uniref:acyl-CoA dehydrogenase family protein n=1 Tax=Massilia sp. METH4 TaxID=3123041 RepID=UPI0030CC58C8
MDLNYSAEDEAFRAQVREFLAANLPPDLRHKVRHHLRLGKEDYVRWHKIAAAQGWAAPGWPVEYGGTGWNAVQRHIWDEECALAGAPQILPFGVNMVAPVIMAFGSAGQKAHYLPRILNCDDWWCQGYSEPGAGSDLASLTTTAVRDETGEHYIVNGQKTWTTLAQHADMIFCLVRTDPAARKQDGISFLLIDMKSPGITVRPITMLDEEHEVNEVFFDNVRVPVANLVGRENEGWTYAKFLLGHERTGIAGVGRSKRELGFLKALAAKQCVSDGTLLDDPLFAARVAQVEIELMALEVTVLRTIAREDKGPGPEASLLKIKGTEVQQLLTELMLDAAGPAALPFDADYLEGRHEHAAGGDAASDHAPLAAYYFNYRKTSIYGGSNEIQKNIIARMILGL